MYNVTTDRDLQRRVALYLHERHRPGLRRLKVQAESGTVEVSGTVDTFYEKQLCQHICRRVAGVVKLVDKVEVSQSEVSSPAEPIMA